MNIKIYIQDKEENELELELELEENLHKSNMFLSAKSLYFNKCLFDVVESVLAFEDDEIQITVVER